MQNKEKKNVFRGIGLKRQISLIFTMGSILISLLSIGSCYSYYDREFQEYDEVDCSSFKGSLVPIHNNTAYQSFDFEEALKWDEDSSLIVMQNKEDDELRLIIVRNDPNNKDQFQYAVKPIEHPHYSIKDPIVIGKKIRYRVERENILIGMLVILIICAYFTYLGLKVYFEWDW